ncbi:putative zinc finger, CCHC-type containing protein [Tanacetum coccineum]
MPQIQGVAKTDFENYVKANDAVLKNVQNQGQNLQNQMANVTSLLTSLCDNFKNSASTSNSGTLPSQTVTNPRQQINAITTRSGKTLEEPSTPLVPTPVTSNPQQEPEQNPETSTEKVQNPNLENTAHVPSPGEEDSIFMEIPKPKAKKTVNLDPNSPNPNSYQSKLPYPERMKVRENDKPSHISRDRMTRLVKDEVLPNLDFSDFEKCVECIKGKMTKGNKKGATRSTGLLELIHTDICGPFPSGIGGHKSFITFIDDYSRYMYLFLINEKSESLDMFKTFKAEVENQLDRKIKVVRSDRGGEYYGRHTDVGQAPGSFFDFCKDHGIINQYTMSEARDEIPIIHVPIPINTQLDTSNDHLIAQEYLNNVEENEPNPDINVEPQETQQSLLRSQQNRQPTNFDDYYTYLNEADFDLGKCNDPESFEDAITCDQSAHWRKAMEDERNSMSKNNIWELAELPKGAKPVRCKWVYKTKLDPNRNVKPYKARLVGKGYTQKKGVNYKETFSHVSRKDSLRIVMALVVHFDLELHQTDVKTTFLNGDLHFYSKCTAMNRHKYCSIVKVPPLLHIYRRPLLDDYKKGKKTTRDMVCSLFMCGDMFKDSNSYLKSRRFCFIQGDDYISTSGEALAL